MLKSKRADIGATLTWLIAILILAGIIIPSIFIATLMSHFKGVGFSEIAKDSGSSSVIDEKTYFANQIVSNENKESVDLILNEGGRYE